MSQPGLEEHLTRCAFAYEPGRGEPVPPTGLQSAAVSTLDRYNALWVGQTVFVDRRISAEAVQRFARETGDNNPIHLDSAAAAAAGFIAPIVHGLLLGSVLAGLIGSELPGFGAVIQSFHLDFRAPALTGDELRFSITVSQKVDALQTVVLALTIHRGETMLVTGRAQVGLRE